jgi:manganese-dependent inorganic pyrophosphatase
VGQDLSDRRDELIQALDDVREREGHLVVALMVTDIMGRDTALYISGDRLPVERAFGHGDGDGVIQLPGVMSRKKQVVPRLLAAAGN